MRIAVIVDCRATVAETTLAARDLFTALQTKRPEREMRNAMDAGTIDSLIRGFEAEIAALLRTGSTAGSDLNATVTAMNGAGIEEAEHANTVVAASERASAIRRRVEDFLRAVQAA